MRTYTAMIFERRDTLESRGESFTAKSLKEAKQLANKTWHDPDNRVWVREVREVTA